MGTDYLKTEAADYCALSSLISSWLDCRPGPEASTYQNPEMNECKTDPASRWATPLVFSCHQYWQFMMDPNVNKSNLFYDATCRNSCNSQPSHRWKGFKILMRSLITRFISKAFIFFQKRPTSQTPAGGARQPVHQQFYKSVYLLFPSLIWSWDYKWGQIHDLAPWIQTQSYCRSNLRSLDISAVIYFLSGCVVWFVPQKMWRYICIGAECSAWKSDLVNPLSP